MSAKREKPHGGARKIQERLLPHAGKVPACSTIHAVLDRHGLVAKMARSRTRAEGTRLSALEAFRVVATAWNCMERIQPGHPQQNGRQERMHLTLKKETTRPAGCNLLQQQGKFDAFLEEFNAERPHEALGMKCPGEIYAASDRPYTGIPDHTTRSMIGPS